MASAALLLFLMLSFLQRLRCGRFFGVAILWLWQ
jgi:hypothetical protein